MKKLIFLFLSLAIFAIPKEVLAYQQTEAVCYSQCAAHKFVWKGDFCMDLFTNQCSISSKDALKNTLKLIKDTAQAMATGELSMIVDVTEVFKAMFICKPLIDDCIVPQLNDCQNTCHNISQTYYAPNLYVGNQYGSTMYQNIYYDENNHQLTFKVTNNGGYAWDIDVTASWGHTPNRDKIVSGGGTLFTEKIPELIFFGARIGSPKTPGDYVTDFLINQSNFSGFLSRFKSDANNHYIPPAWYKTIPFTAPAGEYTKVTLNVDQNQMIPESSEDDNMTIYEIDNLPTPVSLSVENLTYRRTNPTSLTQYLVSFDLKNSGEESGNAHVKWYEGNYETGKTPIHEQTMVVQGLNKISFDYTLNVDVSNGGDSCNYSQKYTLVVFDDDGFIKTRHEFSIPKYAGSINGKVEDLLGKKVVGAKVSTSTGQEAIVNDSGYYHIKGIPTLGKITVTATHHDFSQIVTKDVEIKFSDSKDKCQIEGLTQNGINFVLKDQDVIFTVTIKDTSGNPVTAQVLASNSNWRFNETVNGTGPLSGMQPGKYMFTISAPGYKTISQDVNAVPNDQSLEFILEKLNGRSDDTGLHLITPKLLWKKTLGTGEKIIGNTTGTKNGKLLVASVADNKAKTRSLFFLDLLTGKQIKETSVPYSVEEQRYVGLDASYDGGTVGLFVNPGMGANQEGIMKIFDAQGSEIGNTTFDKKLAIAMDVSPDGFYLCPHLLINKGLHKYSKFETQGIGDDDFKRNPAVCGDYFLRNNNWITSCKDGLCEQTLAKKQVRVIGKLDENANSTMIDSTNDDNTVVVRTYKKLYYFGKPSWNKELKSDSDYKSVSVSPGGMYTIVTEGSGSDALLKLKIFGNTGGDKTPDFPYKDVKFVYANDKGLFFASIVLNRVSFYQIGEYSNEYHPESITPTISPEWTDGLSYYSYGQFRPAGLKAFFNLDPGLIYRADKSLSFSMTDLVTNSSLGTLSITKDSLFSIDNSKHPILLKGQMTADFNSPATVYAIKFNRFDMGLFQTKLDQFIAGNLSGNEYFVVKNIHTKFTLNNLPNTFNVIVDNGQVSLTTDKSEKIINSGKQISIDANNKITESFYFGSKIYFILVLILIIVGFFLLFIYRKTKTGGKILHFLKLFLLWILKTFKNLYRLLCLIFNKLNINIHQTKKKKS
jgi:hypothetical protein